jgi:PKD repeat protein
MRTSTRLLLIAATLVAAACTVKDTSAPPLAGPSELSLRLGLQVVPDSILQDGASQAVLSVEAVNGDGTVARGLPLRVEILVDNVVVDYGTLSTKQVVTGDDGRARIIYTAPPKPGEAVEQNRAVQLRVTPIGNDFGGSLARFVWLRLVTPGIILPPNSAPVPEFTSTGNLQPFTEIVFDASTTTDPDLVSTSNPTGACGANCSYSWDFGDGSTGSGIFARHQYRAAGTYQLKLTATDARGASGTLARPMQIGAATLPTAAFTFSPQSPINTNQTIFFNAEGSRAATGRRLVRYDWNFGNGRTDSGVTTTFSYPTNGTYLVTLIVTDDIGEKSNPVTATVTIGGAPTVLTASLSISPVTSASAPVALTAPVLFNASGSTGPVRIVEYRFNFGDGSPEGVNTLPSWTHHYQAAGIYTVRLTVRDAEGRTAFATGTVYAQ